MGKPHEVSKRVFLSADVHAGHVTAPLSSRRVLRAAAGVGEGRLMGFRSCFEDGSEHASRAGGSAVIDSHVPELSGSFLSKGAELAI